MGQSEQLKLAISAEEQERRRRSAQRQYMDELDEQIAGSMHRWEEKLGGGIDAHKAMARRLDADGDERPVATTTVYDWLSRRNNRRPPAELVAVLYEEDEKFAQWWHRRHGYAPAVKLVLLPADEQVRRLCAEAVRRFGPGGEQMVREVLGQRPEAS